MRMQRSARLTIAAALLAPSLALAQAKPLSAWERADDFTLGSPSARVVLIEYGSTMCPACAAFHSQVLPEIKTRYVDTGRVRYVFRTYPTGGAQYALLGAVLARCAGPRGYYPAVQRLMDEQMWVIGQIQRGGTAGAGAIQLVASDGGTAMTQAQMDACLADKPAAQRVLDIAREGETRYQIAATPTLVINGAPLAAPAGYTVASVSAALDRALAPAPAAPARRR
jgi:protein-disulfide isomerase